MQVINILRLLKKSPLFSSLDDVSLKKLLRKFKKIRLAPGKFLFQRGEEANGVYFLVTGSIGLYFKENLWVLTVQPGETIGELSALSGEPRSINAKAQEHSTLLMLSGMHFRDFCESYPTIAFNTIHFLVNRSNQLIQSLSEKKSESRYVAVAPVNPNINLKKFSEQLIMHHKGLTNVKLLSDYDTEFQKYENIFELRSAVDALEKQYEVIIFILKSHETLLAQVSFERKSQLYLAAYSDAEPSIHPFLKEKIHFHIYPVHLVLLQESKSSLLYPTAKWLNLVPFELNHNIKLDQKKDHQRLLRFMCGQANGVVLGGGGLRSWAHIGALEAISEMEIPIDMIGGVSAGAIVAAHYILHGIDKKAQAGLRELSNITRKIISFKNLTWPTLSLFNTKNYAEKQRELFDNILIEDMSLPCFFVACNLSRNKEVIYRKGSLWKSIASSTAVPAIFPPMAVEGELEVDGGILNNLPVDIMKRFLGPRGKVIAVELTRYDQDQNKYNFPSYISTLDIWKNKLGFSKEHYILPNFLDVFLNSLLAGSAYKQEENSRQADLLIKPDLSKFGLMNVSLKQENRLIQIGKKVTKDAIDNQQFLFPKTNITSIKNHLN